jgi:hypothetical protein
MHISLYENRSGGKVDVGEWLMKAAVGLLAVGQSLSLGRPKAGPEGQLAMGRRGAGASLPEEVMEPERGQEADQVRSFKLP